MKIVLADNHGFCFGVERAIKMAEENPNAKTFGPIIHNAREISRLNKNFNIDVINDLKELDKNNTNTVIIRTHGVPKQDIETLKKTNTKIVDTTCPYVTKLQKICNDMSKQGYEIVIFGDKEHPEVKGANSWATKSHIVLLSSELDNVKLDKKIALVSQTTKKQEDFDKIYEYLKGRCDEVKVFNTICDATLKNQDSARDLSTKVDSILVIGGRNSSNTKQLFNICKINCENTYLIEDKNDIKLSWFNDVETCGITAGASTPKWLIDEVIDKIKENK